MSVDMYTNQILQQEFPFLHIDTCYGNRKQASIDFSTSIKNAISKWKKNKRANLRFRTKYNPRQQFATGCKIVDSNHIKISKLKSSIRAKGLKSYPDGNIVVAKILKEKDRYYIVLTFKQERKTPWTKESISNNPENYNSIGIDLGLKDFLTASDGEIVKNPKYYRKLEKKLAKEQRKLSKKIKGSNNYNKQKKKVQRIHEKIVNQRTDFLHKLSTDLANNYFIICTEDLNISGMKRRFGKSISDVSWSRFLYMLSYKLDYQNKILQKIDRFYPSSQLCSIYGYKNTEVKDLSIREWACPSCNTEHDRDINAAVNILNEGLKLVRQGMSESALLETV